MGETRFCQVKAPPHESSQSGQSGGRDSNAGTSHRNHSGGGGTGLCNESVVKDDSSIKGQRVD